MCMTTARVLMAYAAEDMIYDLFDGIREACGDISPNDVVFEWDYHEDGSLNNVSIQTHEDGPSVPFEWDAETISRILWYQGE